MTNTFTPGTRVNTPDGAGVVTEAPFLMSSGWTVSVEHDVPVSASGGLRYRLDEITEHAPTTTPQDDTDEAATPDFGLTAARAINAHPWLSAVYPEAEDTDLLISPPWPTKLHDELRGYVEGRATWNARPDGTVHYRVALAYEPRNGVTVEDEVTAEITPGPLAWLDLARPIAELMERLHAEAHVPVDA